MRSLCTRSSKYIARHHAALLAVFGVITLAVGVGLVWVPAGVICAGLSMIATAYVVRYLEVQSANAPSSGRSD